MLHPATELRSLGPLGTGVVATERIPKGTVVWVLDAIDQLVTPEAVKAMPSLLRKAVRNHGYFDRTGNIVLCWDHARFVNHSCEPNCLSPGYGFEVAIVDIEPGDAITNDYLTLNLACDFECACGVPTCRKNIHAASAHAMVPVWDGWLRDALPHVFEVDQPLMSLVNPKDRANLKLFAQGTKAPRSSKWHLVDEPLRLPT